jgi:hypothetical protein
MPPSFLHPEQTRVHVPAYADCYYASPVQISQPGRQSPYLHYGKAYRQGMRVSRQHMRPGRSRLLGATPSRYVLRDVTVMPAGAASSQKLLQHLAAQCLQVLGNSC